MVKVIQIFHVEIKDLLESQLNSKGLSSYSSVL